MQPSLITRAAHTPLIRFVGSRTALWKDAPHHSAPHALTPAQLEKHVAKATDKSTKSKAIYVSMSELPAKYRRSGLTDKEAEAIESGGASLF